MDNKPLLSICIPTYNRVLCLQQCLESITEQFKNPLILKNVEVVISDNASTDDTENLVKKYQEKFPNILYHKNIENIGIDRNILTVTEKANGNYVWLLGDDDALFPDAIAHILKKIKLKEFKYCLVNCLGYDSNLINPALRYPNLRIQADQHFEKLLECVKKTNKKDLVGLFCGLSGQIFDKKIWESWPEKQKYIGSNAVHLHVLLSAMKNQKFIIIAKPLVKVRAANIRWETFSGLETLVKRTQSTSKSLVWILETYEIPYSKLSLKIEQGKNILFGWTNNILRNHIFKNQKSRDFIKRLLGKL